MGHLLKGRFKSLLVDKEGSLQELCRYVVLNPVRAGMVAEAGGWAWSSYRATAGIQAAPGWLDVAAALSLFDRTMATAWTASRRFVAEGIHQPAVYLLRRAANEPLQAVAMCFRISPSRISNIQKAFERAPCSPQQTQLFATCNVKS